MNGKFELSIQKYLQGILDPKPSARGKYIDQK